MWDTLYKSEKISFTAFGGTTSSGDKRPLWVIAKGKAKPREAKRRPRLGIIITHAKSGWATENFIVGYLQ
jgi:hypothetical protein